MGGLFIKSRHHPAELMLAFWFRSSQVGAGKGCGVSLTQSPISCRGLTCSKTMFLQVCDLKLGKAISFLPMRLLLSHFQSESACDFDFPRTSPQCAETGLVA